MVGQVSLAFISNNNRHKQNRNCPKFNVNNKHEFSLNSEETRACDHGVVAMTYDQVDHQIKSTVNLTKFSEQ